MPTRRQCIEHRSTTFVEDLNQSSVRLTRSRTAFAQHMITDLLSGERQHSTCFHVVNNSPINHLFRVG